MPDGIYFEVKLIFLRVGREVNRRATVLIAGAGIAGPTLAYWLARRGFIPTIVERSPTLRTGGYVIDFWGVGFDVAERMGLLPAIQPEGYVVHHIDIVDRRGRPIAHVPTAGLTAAFPGRFTSLPRGALATAIFRTVVDSVDVMFGDEVRHLDDQDDGVLVTFARRAPRTFDLVVGADGLHSNIRELAFGPESRFERYLGLKVAAFDVAGYRPRDELTYVMYSQPGQHIARFALRENRTMFLMIFADADDIIPPTIAAQKAVLHARFDRAGWESRRILEDLDSTNDLYFDRVSQISMRRWVSEGLQQRVTLVGDAAFCISLLGGQGASLAMAAAYVLAGELSRANGDHRTAFSRYQQLFEPFVARKQKMARRFAAVLAPRSRAALFARDQACRLLAFKPLAHLLGARGFADQLSLPMYDAGITAK